MDWEFILLAIGTGAAVVGVLWAVFTYVLPRKAGDGENKVSSKTGVAVGRDLKKSTITIGAKKDEP